MSQRQTPDARPETFFDTDFLRRLGTYSRKNKLYFAFVELGKVIRTMFLLSYIGDVGLRKVIHAETNKSEQFNGFAQWSFFGGGCRTAGNPGF